MTKLIEKWNAGVDFDHLYNKDVATRFCVLLALKYAGGHDNRLRRNQLVEKVRQIWIYKVDHTIKPPGERKIRNTIRELRKEGALIMSTGGRKGGYWKASDYKEVKDFIKLEYRARALDMLHTSSKMLRSAREKFGGQRDIWREISIDILKMNEGIICLED